MIRTKDDKIKLLVELIAKFPSNERSKCPATMLADKRIDRVIGRIMFLVSSIITMKFIRAIGVPMGTVWINMFLL